MMSFLISSRSICPRSSSSRWSTGPRRVPTQALPRFVGSTGFGDPWSAFGSPAKRVANSEICLHSSELSSKRFFHCSSGTRLIFPPGWITDSWENPGARRSYESGSGVIAACSRSMGIQLHLFVSGQDRRPMLDCQRSESLEGHRDWRPTEVGLTSGLSAPTGVSPPRRWIVVNGH